MGAEKVGSLLAVGESVTAGKIEGTADGSLVQIPQRILHEHGQLRMSRIMSSFL